MIYVTTIPGKNSMLSVISDKQLLPLDLLKFDQISSVIWHVSWPLFRVCWRWRNYCFRTSFSARKFYYFDRRTIKLKALDSSIIIFLQDRWKESSTKILPDNWKDSQEFKGIIPRNYSKTHENRYECGKIMLTSAHLKSPSYAWS